MTLTSRASRTGDGHRRPVGEHLFGAVCRVRSHCRFRKRGAEHVSEYGMKWMSGSAERQCDRALAACARVGVGPLS